MHNSNYKPVALAVGKDQSSQELDDLYGGRTLRFKTWRKPDFMGTADKAESAANRDQWSNLQKRWQEIRADEEAQAAAERIATQKISF
jgi:hypothetical protein